MWLYAIACSAEKVEEDGQKRVDFKAMSLLASHRVAAETKAMVKCQAYFPKIAGWEEHCVDVDPLKRTDIVSYVRGVLLTAISVGDEQR